MSRPALSPGVPIAHDSWWDREGRYYARQRRLRVGLQVAVTFLVVALGALLLGAGGARAASLSLDLDQWATKANQWQNGDLNGNNAAYPEGGVIPFRLAIEGLSVGQHSIHINYDFTAGGHKAYDFLATWNATNGPNLCQQKGGAISSMCPNLGSPSTYTFPSDPFVANGLKVSSAMTYAGMPRKLTIYGGSIVSISTPSHSGSVNGNSSADMLVRFRANGSAVLLAWGGHLAQSSFWDQENGGPLDGAGEVSGAPWHMRTLQLDGSGNRNQDRSIQPSAIVGALGPGGNPTPAPGQPGPGPAGGIPTPPPTTTVEEPTLPAGVPPALVVLAAAFAAGSVTWSFLLDRRRRRR